MGNKMTERDRDVAIWIMICNTIKVVSFVCLACVFGQWWIALFSVLFLTTRYKVVETKDGGAEG